jgi:hypothetical protein
MGLWLGRYYFISIFDFLVFCSTAMIVGSLGLFVAQFFRKLLSKVIARLSISFTNRHYLFGIMAIFSLNYPLYLLIDIFQTSANSHIEPNSGDLAAYFLGGLLFFCLRYLIKHRRDIVRKKVLVILFAEIVVMLIYWILRYHGMVCTRCNLNF